VPAVLAHNGETYVVVVAGIRPIGSAAYAGAPDGPARDR
jgi:hypothetical protein